MKVSIEPPLKMRRDGCTPELMTHSKLNPVHSGIQIGLNVEVDGMEVCARYQLSHLVADDEVAIGCAYQRMVDDVMEKFRARLVKALLKSVNPSVPNGLSDTESLYCLHTSKIDEAYKKRWREMAQGILYTTGP